MTETKTRKLTNSEQKLYNKIAPVFNSVIDKYHLDTELTEIKPEIKQDITGDHLHCCIYTEKGIGCNIYLNLDLVQDIVDNKNVYWNTRYADLNSEQKIKAEVLKAIASDLNSVNIAQFLTDDDVQQLLDSKLRHDPDSHLVLNQTMQIKNDVDYLHSVSYWLYNQYNKLVNPINVRKSLASALKPDEIMLSNEFIDWCYNSYMANKSTQSMLTYPERACLSLNTIEEFITDLNFSSVDDENRYTVNDVLDEYDIQDKIITGLGTVELGKQKFRIKQHKSNINSEENNFAVSDDKHKAEISTEFNSDEK